MAVKGNGKFNSDPMVQFTERNEVAEAAKGWASASIHKTCKRKTPSRRPLIFLVFQTLQFSKC